MVVITGAVVGAVATFPPAVALFGQAGATAAGSVAIPAIAAAEGIGAGSAVVAIGEGAVVGAGVIGGGSGSAGIALATFVGPIGWAVVGCKKTDDQPGESGDGQNGESGDDQHDESSYTWDCWKPVIRDTSTLPSYGMTLHCLATHPNVRYISLDTDGLLVGNIFDERFRLTPVNVKGTLAFHASILSL
jgi:hypothetical protein